LTNKFHDANSPKAIFRSHRKSHNAIITNEFWYGDGLPDLGESFTAKSAVKRHRQIRQILKRAAKRERNNGNHALANAYSQLRKRLKECRPGRRCGWSACPKCARAFQRAKTDAHLKAIDELGQKRKRKKLVLVTIIPKQFARSPSHFLELNPLKANRWLRDVLDRARIKRVVIDSIDFGWEKRAGDKYLQLHWHLAMWTQNRKALVKKLKKAFKPERWCTDPRYKQPIQVKAAKDLDFVPYIHKLIKLPKLLRSGRRILPELCVLLGGYDSMDFVFLRKMRLSAQSNGIVFKEIKG
jgi:hypothetical protein